MNVAVVGCGEHSRKVHLPIWRALPNVSLVGLYDVNSAAAKYAAKWFKAEVFKDLNDVVSDPSVDIVDICTPTSTHYPIAMKAIQCHKNVLVEKPICLSSASARSLIDEGKRCKVKLGVVQHYIYSRAIQRLKRLLDEGKDSSGNSTDLIEVFYPMGRADPSRWISQASEGGLIYELGIHPAYILAYLCGEAESVDVIGEPPSGNREAFMSVHLKFADARGAIRFSPHSFFQYIIRIEHGTHFIVADPIAETLFEWKPKPPSPKEDPLLHFAKSQYLLSARYFRQRTFGYSRRACRYILYNIKELNQSRLFKGFLSYVNGSSTRFESDGEVGFRAVKIVEQIARHFGITRDVTRKTTK